MERLLARLERRFGRYAIHGLTYMLVVVMAIVLVLGLTTPGYLELLTLDRERVMHGQVWRLVTYLFIPPSMSPLWALFALYWLYTMGTALEEQWGSFKYQIYWLIGMVSTTVIAFVLRTEGTNAYLIMSLLLAFATYWPDYEIRLFFIIPVKVKWLALLDALALLGMIAGQSGWQRALPMVAVGNYLLFFTPALLEMLRRNAGAARRTGARAAFRNAAPPAPRAGSRKCTVCGVTDADPAVEFRVCTCEKCGGKPTEFCLTHARNH